MPQVSLNFDDAANRAVLRITQGAPSDDWWGVLTSSIRGVAFDVEERDGYISTPWHSFLQARRDVGGVLGSFGVDLDVDDVTRDLLQSSLDSESEFETAASAPPLDQEMVKRVLLERGFKRTLSDNQRTNVASLARLPSGATFSVPGAGKTTEALAFFTMRAQPTTKLLVVAPINAFGSWEREQTDCFEGSEPSFVRLRGGADAVQSLLAAEPRFSIVNYESLPNLREELAQFLDRHDVFVFLDESHRIKGGEGKARADAALSLAPFASGKLILSGTPMPQDRSDLVPQVRFLYPELLVEPDDVVDRVRSIFVRTNKTQLGLPTPNRETVFVDMSPGQEQLYGLMTDEFARQAALGLDVLNRAALRALGSSVMRILQLVSNPALIAEHVAAAHEDLLADVLMHDSPKVAYACERARELVARGEKVLIWTTFRQNVEIIAARLGDLGAVFVHGGIGPGDENDLARREGRIKAFKEDNRVRVLVANPAAAAEGISLHNICKHAIYVDRTYNAAHYLQSEDRILRFGLKPGIVPEIEIIECRDSIDQRIRERLNLKINRMSEVLSDPSIRIDPPDSPIDPDVVEDDEDRMLGMTQADASDFVESLQNP